MDLQGAEGAEQAVQRAHLSKEDRREGAEEVLEGPAVPDPVDPVREQLEDRVWEARLVEEEVVGQVGQRRVEMALMEVEVVRLKVWAVLGHPAREELWPYRPLELTMSISNISDARGAAEALTRTTLSCFLQLRHTAREHAGELSSWIVRRCRHRRRCRRSRRCTTSPSTSTTPSSASAASCNNTGDGRSRLVNGLYLLQPLSSCLISLSAITISGTHTLDLLEQIGVHIGLILLIKLK